MSKPRRIMALDVGEKRIGVAHGDSGVRIAIADQAIDVDGTEIQKIAKMVLLGDVDTLVIGYPRNQQGETTNQTAYVEEFAKRLEDIDVNIHFQDESLTSVLAENRLKSYGKPYQKADIDAMAAVIILEDYLGKL